MRVWIKVVLIILVVFLTSASIYIISSTWFYDRSNPRNRPNSYLSEVSIEINRPIHEVYLFVKYQKAKLYNKFTDMHQQFKIINADALSEGAIVECIESDDEDIIHHRYVVIQDIEDGLIHYESTPSTIYSKENNRVVGVCNTYVYYDFVKVDENKTLLKQTVVIDMLNPIYKAIGDIVGLLSGSRNTWSHQFLEELKVLGDHINA